MTWHSGSLHAATASFPVNEGAPISSQFEFTNSREYNENGVQAWIGCGDNDDCRRFRQPGADALIWARSSKFEQLNFQLWLLGNGLRASNMAYYWSGADLHRPRPDTGKVHRARQSLLQSLFAMEICT